MYPIKSELCPVIITQKPKIKKGAKTFLYHRLDNGDVYTTIPKELYDEKGDNNIIVLSPRNGEDFNIIYAEFIPDKGLLLRHLYIPIDRINLELNQDIRSWDETKFDDWFPFIIGLDGKIYNEDGITPKFTGCEGRYYNKRAFEIMTALAYRKGLREVSASRLEEGKFAEAVGFKDIVHSGWGISLWYLAKSCYAKMLPRRDAKTLEKIKSKSEEKWIMPFTTEQIQEIKKSLTNNWSKTVWLVDPKEDTPEEVVLHQVSFYEEKPKEYARIWYKQGDKDTPLILKRTGERWEKITSAQLYYWNFFKEKDPVNSFAKAAALTGDAKTAYKIFKHPLYRKLYEQGMINILKVFDRTGENHYAFFAKVPKIKVETFGTPENLAALNEYLGFIMGPEEKEKLESIAGYYVRDFPIWVMENLLWYFHEEIKTIPNFTAGAVSFIYEMIKSSKNRDRILRFASPYGYREGLECNNTEKLLLTQLIDLYRKTPEERKLKMREASYTLLSTLAKIRDKERRFDVYIPEIKTIDEIIAFTNKIIGRAI